VPLAKDLSLQVSLQLDSLKTLTSPRDLTKEFGQLDASLVAFETAVTTAIGDGNLSLAGKISAFDAARKTATSAIDDWLKKHDAALAQAETAALSTLPGPKDPAPEAVQAMLASIREFDPTQVASLYASASDTERHVIEHAAKLAGRLPRKVGDNIVWQPLLDLEDETVASMVDARRQRAAGAAWSRVQDIRRLRNAHRAVAGGARALVTTHLESVSLR
jgi:hypothetical protein